MTSLAEADDLLALLADRAAEAREVVEHVDPEELWGDEADERYGDLTFADVAAQTRRGFRGRDALDAALAAQIRLVVPPAAPRVPRSRERRRSSGETRTSRETRAGPDDPSRPPDRRCEVCGGPLAGRRRQSTTCGDACRQKLYRRRHGARPATRSEAVPARSRRPRRVDELRAEINDAASERVRVYSRLVCANGNRDELRGEVEALTRRLAALWDDLRWSRARLSRDVRATRKVDDTRSAQLRRTLGDREVVQ